MEKNKLFLRAFKRYARDKGQYHLFSKCMNLTGMMPCFNNENGYHSSNYIIDDVLRRHEPQVTHEERELFVSMYSCFAQKYNKSSRIAISNMVNGFLNKPIFVKNLNSIITFTAERVQRNFYGGGDYKTVSLTTISPTLGKSKRSVCLYDLTSPITSLVRVEDIVNFGQILHSNEDLNNALSQMVSAQTKKLQKKADSIIDSFKPNE